MRGWMLVAGALISGSSFSGYAFAQAAAEAVMTHGAASVAGTSVGTMVGRAASQLGEKVGQQTSSRTARSTITPVRVRSRGQAKVPALVVRPVPSNGSLVAAIEGAEPEESLCHEVLTVAAVPAHAVKGNARPSQPLGVKCKAQETPSADVHPSVVNLAPVK